MQYTEIKQRLERIEDTLKSITSHIEAKSDTNASNEQQQLVQTASKPTGSIQLFNRMNMKQPNHTNKINESSVFSLTNLNKAHVKELFTSTNLLIALAAWLIGLLSAIFSYKLFKISPK